MKDWSRRNVLRAAAGAAIAVPMAALATGAASAATPAGAAGGETGGEAGGLSASEGIAGPVMFCVHDAQAGQVSILHGTSEVIVTDRQLVARILSAAATA